MGLFEWGWTRANIPFSGAHCSATVSHSPLTATVRVFGALGTILLHLLLHISPFWSFLWPWAIFLSFVLETYGHDVFSAKMGAIAPFSSCLLSFQASMYVSIYLPPRQ